MEEGGRRRGAIASLHRREEVVMGGLAVGCLLPSPADGGRLVGMPCSREDDFAVFDCSVGGIGTCNGAVSDDVEELLGNGDGDRGGGWIGGWLGFTGNGTWKGGKRRGGGCGRAVSDRRTGDFLLLATGKGLGEEPEVRGKRSSSPPSSSGAGYLAVSLTEGGDTDEALPSSHSILATSPPAEGGGVASSRSGGAVAVGGAAPETGSLLGGIGWGGGQQRGRR